jgi:translocation and assembly module TamB
VTGTRAAPRVAGRVALDDGRFQLAAAGIPYEDVRARIEADGGRIVVREMQAKAGDGTASVSGAVVLERGADALDVRVRLDRFFAVRTESYEAAVSGDVAVRGALDAPDVSGTLAVDRALVRPAALPASGRSIPKDPTIEVVGLPGPPADEAGKHPASAIAKALTLAVSITIEKNAWIRRNDANIELAGKIDVTKARGEQPRIVGQIRLLRGWYVFQGRRFNLDQGTITFTGASPPKPIFDVTAIYKTQEYRIEIHITGSSDKPKLDLTSDPPLEQADVLSVVLFGKPAHQLGKGQSVALQQQALQLAAGYVMPELRTSVMNSLGLDTLEVEMPPEGTDTGPRVSAGRYVSEDVFVSLSQEFGRREGQAVGIEYDVGRNVSIRASTSTRGDSAIDLFWRHRY